MVLLGENQDNEGLPGQVDEESSQPADWVKSTVLPTSAVGDSGDAELLGDLLSQQVGVAGVSSHQLDYEVFDGHRKRNADDDIYSNC